MEDTVYEGPEPKRLIVAIGVDMAKGYEGEELVDRVVERERDDEEMMAMYDNDVEQLRDDVERLAAMIPDHLKEDWQDSYETRLNINKRDAKTVHEETSDARLYGENVVEGIRARLRDYFRGTDTDDD